MLQQFFLNLDPQTAQSVLRLIVLSLVVAGLGAFWFFGRSRESVVGFKLREADRVRPKRSLKMPALVQTQAQTSAGKASAPKKAPLLLSGIRIDGSPLEILGLKENATNVEIQKAYRDLMKRYHPDLVGRPGSREWKDAQLIAEALNQAKEALLKRVS